MKKHAPILLAIAAALTLAPSAQAQPAPQAARCDATAERLETELRRLSERVARAETSPEASTPASATRILAELLQSGALRAHLQCLGAAPTGR